MAKRFPLSRATKELACLLKPLGASEDAVADAGADLSDETIVDVVSAIYEVEKRHGVIGFDDFPAPEEYVWMARWAACKQVYRIDPEVAAALSGQRIEGEMPIEAILRMPYPIVYVDVPVDYSNSDDTGAYWKARAKGFLAYIDTDPRNGNPELNIIYMFEPDDWGKRRGVVTLSLGFGTLDQVVGEVIAMEDAEVGRKASDGEVELFRRCVEQALNLLLYVIHEEEDAQVVYAPPKAAKAAKPGKRSNPETVTQLGAAMGRRIGEARRAPAGARAAGCAGRTVAPHLRRAHWHCYWTGQRKGRSDGKKGDELVVRWIPPIEVGGSGVGKEVIHR